MSILQIKNLSKDFGGLRVLENISFSLDEGSVVGLIGPNGAGKSTLVNLIGGGDQPTRGEIYFGSRRLNGLPAWRIARLGLARTFQITRIFSDLTLDDNVRLAAWTNGWRGKNLETEVARLIALTELSDKTGVLGRDLTLSDQKRLQLARALALKPKLLLLDEVMAGLNPSELDRAIQLLAKLRNEGITMLVIEHLMRVIMSISDRVLVLHQGTLIADGPPAEIVASSQVQEAYLGRRYVKNRGGFQPDEPSEVKEGT
ncbi:Putative ABC transporter [Acididesulfobacillus acetoxydans]|uniref:ABC transporter n=1 Tax=Acididesulfobacillus acetoxydans TaxID=1561005 RepID=A0A8S0WFM6_9FIRM|nr:ABC transporter ATP-binding protein [Acididesulfobacillus acetoxydans]CAA7601192.1 Putative ABC transporter [Acididesulfobacillus acetoxydans]CEJ08529.1 Monosaccharide-transporting ATPase [Acididesulfobacillus acetoxydans]